MVIIMKKLKFLKNFYSIYCFATENEKLSDTVTEICNVLKNGVIVVEVFSKDPLNNTLDLNSKFFSQNGNFNYYICEQTDFFKNINFFNAKYISIYSIEELPPKITTKFLNNNFTFFICFENYFDTSHLKVYLEQYSDSIENFLNQHEYLIKKRF